MNHLRELLETDKRDLMYAVDSLPRDTAAKLHDLFRVGGETAMCFFGGEATGLEGLTWAKELCRLPFQCCWFEFLADEVIVGILAVDHGDSISFSRYSRERARNEWSIIWVGTCDALGEPVTCNSAKQLHREDAAVVTAAICIFLTAMNCKNVTLTEHKPDLKLQKARAKRGKAPLFAYWTLHLEGRREPGEHYGGTHASPRLHLRRGHPRQYAAGFYTWVQPTIVGNKAAGMVHKDYSAGKHLLSPAQ